MSKSVLSHASLESKKKFNNRTKEYCFILCQIGVHTNILVASPRIFVKILLSGIVLIPASDWPNGSSNFENGNSNV